MAIVGWRIIINQFRSALIYKSFSLLCVFAVPYFLMTKLSVEQYGIWSLVQSTIMWIFLLDLGIGSALQNRLSGEDRFKVRLSYLTYVNRLNLVLSFFIALIGTCVIFTFKNQHINSLFFLAYIIISSTIPFNIVGKYATYRNNSQQVELYSFLSNLFFLLSLLLYSNDNVDLNSIVLLFAVTLCIPKVYFFCKNKLLRISIINVFNKRLIKLTVADKQDFIRLSLSFFIAQALFIVLLSSIRYYFALNEKIAEAGLFDILFRPLTVGLMLFVLILRPIWVSISFAHKNNDRSTCITIIFKVFALYFIFAGTVFLAFYCGFIGMLYKSWIQKVIFTEQDIVSIGIFGMLLILHNIISYVMNGLSLIKEQVKLNILGLLVCFYNFYFMGNQSSFSDVVISFSYQFIPLIILGSILLFMQIRRIGA